MKLEYLSEGSPDCPLIRLYRFTQEEALRLRAIVNELSNGHLQYLALHIQPGIEPIDECQLLMKRDKLDQGIVQRAPRRFECVLSEAGWRDVSLLLEPFCETDTRGFQWLVEKGPISLLISAKGTW